MPGDRGAHGKMNATRAINTEEAHMGKRGRKKKARKGNAANHGKRPNS